LTTGTKLGITTTVKTRSDATQSQSDFTTLLQVVPKLFTLEQTTKKSVFEGILLPRIVVVFL